METSPNGLDLVLKNVQLLGGDGERFDIGIDNGHITELGEGLSGAESMDMGGLCVMPGVVDTQVHFRDPGLTHKEDLESGSRAAIMGGVTTFFDMPNTVPNTTTETRLTEKRALARNRSWADYGFFIGASEENVDELRALEKLPGCPGIKIFMGSSTGSLLVEEDSALEAVLANGFRPCPVHAEDEARLRKRKAEFGSEVTVLQHPDIRDAEAARFATARLIDLCRKTGRPIHVLHVSTADELPLLKAAKAEGLPITCEVTPQHLALSAPSAYEQHGSHAQMNPPIRSESHRLALWEALGEGLFDVFGSDHAPHTIEEKAKDYPNSPSGIPGVQTMLPWLLTWAAQGKLPYSQIIEMACRRPAELYGIEKKGQIAIGFDADLVFVNPTETWTVEPRWLQSKCGWSPFLGAEMQGKIRHVLLRGNFVVLNESLCGLPIGRAVSFDWK